MNVVTDPVDQLNALSGIAWKLPDQERREIESIATTRRWTGHLRWLSAPQKSRLFDLYRKHVRGEA